MRRLLASAATIVLLAACASSSPPATIPPDAVPATLVTVRDGDSLVVDIGDLAEVEVRLIGINAPESDECHGAAARAALESLVAGADLTVQRDGDDRDQYGRLLGYLFADGDLVNAALVRDGHALAVHGLHSRRDEFLALDDAAYRQGRGMWASDACGAPPPDGPRLTDAAWDPPGNDAEQPEREWVEITNQSDQDVAMDGWLLRDESSQHRFTFPAGFTLHPMETVRVHSGCGEPATGHLWWCTGAVWSNGGDTAILQDGDGTVADRLRAPAPS